MVKYFFFILIVLLLGACHTDKSNGSSKESVILSNLLSNELDSVVLELSELDTGYFSKYLHGFDIKRGKVLVKISSGNGDTLVDFFVYDTSYRNETEFVSINGFFSTPERIFVQISDEEEIARGILYETQHNKNRLSIDLSHSIHKPMIFHNGRLEINPPPLYNVDD